jgi:hypothetical protein
MTLLDIIKKGLDEIEADGLSDGLECGCGIDDIAPCGSLQDCYPAKYNEETKMYERL